MNALVTLVAGAKYQSRFRKYCYPNWMGYPQVMSQSGSLLERVKNKLGLPTASQERLRAVLPEILESAYFLHFAGAQNDMRLLSAAAPTVCPDVRQVA